MKSTYTVTAAAAGTTLIEGLDDFQSAQDMIEVHGFSFTKYLITEYRGISANQTWTTTRQESRFGS